MTSKTTPSPRKYLLWDASIVIPCYIPEATRNQVAAKRAKNVLDAVRNHHLDAVCLIPNIVVAEVFTAFARECYSGWDSQVYKKYGGKGSTLHTSRYHSARKRFRRDIHNGVLFYQLDLCRYHILALDLVAPVDKSRKYYRKPDQHSMGASDLLIGAMGIHLVKLHGRDRVALLTADRRMDAIFGRACPKLKPSVVKKLGLLQQAKTFGFGKWEPTLYPRVIDLERCRTKELTGFFGDWPLKTRKKWGKPPKA